MGVLSRIQLNESRGDLDIQAREPIPETYVGTNIPYRGTEQHGQIHKDTFVEPPQHGREYDPPYEDPIPEHPPIPVKIVEQYGRELKKSKIYQRPSGTNGGVLGQPVPALIVQLRYGRSQVIVKNAMTSAFTIYIADTSEGCSSGLGWPLQFGEVLYIKTEGELWAWADSVSPGTLGIIEEYTVEE